MEPVTEMAEARPEMEQATEALEAELKLEPPEEEPPQTVIDLATPTLAELYYSQGQILEAIATYEKVLLNKPDDKASEQRLAQLRASIPQESEPIPSEEDVFPGKDGKNHRDP